MAKIVTEVGLVEESSLTWNLWREDRVDSWSIVHELRNAAGDVVRRDVWVNFKGVPIPAAELKPGDM